MVDGVGIHEVGVLGNVLGGWVEGVIDWIRAIFARMRRM